MKILIVHQYFNTPETGGPLRSYYLANGLKSNGYEVEVITSHNQKKSTSRKIDGFTVHYLPVYYDNSLAFTARMIAFVKFAWLAYLKALKLKKVDLCYAISTPLTVGWIAQKLKAARDIPYVFEVGDLWPEAPIQMGVIRTPWIIKWLRRFEREVYQGADSIVALSPGIRDSIMQSAPGRAVSIIPNMSDCQFFQMERKEVNLEHKYGVRNKLVITYFGAAGRANHLEFLLDAARHAGYANPSLHFLIVANGSELGRLKRLATKYNLNNLDFLGYQNRDRLRQVLNITDAVYVSYADVPVLTTGCPNKYFDGLAAGKLMLINFQGWLKTITELHGLGFYVDPRKPAMLSQVLESVVLEPSGLARSQVKARMIAETFFSRGLAIQKLLKVLGHQSTAAKEAEVYTLTA